jgi:hypothetical protein
MNHLEIVAAQRDELAAKLHTTGQQLAAAQQEIARLQAGGAPHHVDVTTVHNAEPKSVAADPPALATVAPIPVKAAPVIPQPENLDGTPFRGEVPSTKPSKSRMPRIFGGKP